METCRKLSKAFGSMLASGHAVDEPYVHKMAGNDAVMQKEHQSAQ